MSQVPDRAGDTGEAATMTPDELTDDVIDYIFANVDEDDVSTWELNFIHSTADQWERQRWLSDRQKEILGQIWDKQS